MRHSGYPLRDWVPEVFDDTAAADGSSLRAIPALDPAFLCLESWTAGRLTPANCRALGRRCGPCCMSQGSLGVRWIAVLRVVNERSSEAANC